MRPLRYSINVTLDGCCDHRAVLADEDLHRHAIENIDQADALLFGRVTYEMMEAAWRPPARTGPRPDWMQPWMEPFARTIDAAKKYVVSSTLDRVDWNAELVRGDLGKAVQQLKQPVIDRTYSLIEAPDAIRYLEKGHPGGKVVITV
jgi:dihydrofolate reductase